MVYLQQEQRRHLGPGATTHVPAAEALLEGVEFDAETGDAAEASEAAAAVAARLRPPRPADWGFMNRYERPTTAMETARGDATFDFRPRGIYVSTARGGP